MAALQDALQVAHEAICLALGLRGIAALRRASRGESQAGSNAVAELEAEDSLPPLVPSSSSDSASDPVIPSDFCVSCGRRPAAEELGGAECWECYFEH